MYVIIKMEIFQKFILKTNQIIQMKTKRVSKNKRPMPIQATTNKEGRTISNEQAQSMFQGC